MRGAELKLNKKMKILVIGSSGFIGKYLCDRLSYYGHKVIGLDIKVPVKRDILSEFILGNILNPEVVEKAVKEVEAIVLLAAKHHDFGISKDEFFNVNVRGMENILKCASEAGIMKFIFYSTVAVYGKVETFSTEDTPAVPISDYGKSKLAAEGTLREWVSQEPKREVVIIRPVVVFGPGNFANMYNLIDKIYRGRFIFAGEGQNIKSVAYVENLVEATTFLLERLKPGMEIYNYSDYPQMNTEEIARNIARYLSCEIPKFKIPLGLAMAAASIFDLMGKITGYNFPITANRIKKFNTPTIYMSDKIRKAGFNPPIELSEGFKRMAEWYLQSGKNAQQIRQKDGESES